MKLRIVTANFFFSHRSGPNQGDSSLLAANFRIFARVCVCVWIFILQSNVIIAKLTSLSPPFELTLLCPPAIEKNIVPRSSRVEVVVRDLVNRPHGGFLP